MLLPERPLCHCKKAFLSPWTGCDRKELGCGEKHERKKEGGGVLKPISFFKCEAWPAGWDSFEHFVPFSEMRVYLHFVCVPICFVLVHSEGLERGFATFRERMATVGRMFF